MVKQFKSPSVVSSKASPIVIPCVVTFGWAHSALGFVCLDAFVEMSIYCSASCVVGVCLCVCVCMVCVFLVEDLIFDSFVRGLCMGKFIH